LKIYKMTRKITLPSFLLSLFVVMGTWFHASAQTPDPGLMGTHAVLKQQYDLGDAYFPSIPTYFPYTQEARGSVHYPADLSGGPYPVLIWLHGRHETCYETANPSNTGSSWPCPVGWQSIVSYEGYDYAARLMASHGYIVISVSANSINAHDASTIDNGMTARGHLVQWHLDLWNTWNTVGGAPFGTTFVGALDLQNIGTMGHSRGGEGVVYNAEYNRSLGSPYGIKAILTLAPVDFYRHVINRIPLMNIAPYCDGDVSDLQGVHFYDDARYKDSTDETPKHAILVMGANHNFFNSVWTPGSYIAGGADDWFYTGGSTTPYCGPTAPGTGRLDTVTQMAVYKTYAAAFYRYYIGHETAFAPILNTSDVIPPTSAIIDSSKLFVSYHPGRTDRTDINRTDSVYNFTVNNLTGSVTTAVLTTPAICGGGLAQPVCDAGPTAGQKPHRGTVGTKGLGQMRIQWVDTNGVYENDIPAAYQDFTGAQSLSFRACENFSETPSGPNLDFSVRLIDSAGTISNQVVNNYTNSLFYEPGVLAGDLPKVVFNTIRIPLSGFTGVNMAKIRKVIFKFNRSTSGAILVSDVALINKPCGNLNANFTRSTTTGLWVNFTNTTQANYGDTVSCLWNFGNPASGVNDTSTLQNPVHHYTATGSYSPCLYVTVKRRNGTICRDTFCTTFSVAPTLGLTTQQGNNITIVPNPAKDYLQISGAAKTDVLKLINLYGQEVFTATLTEPVLQLPVNLPAGFYYAVVISEKGNVYKKLLITQ
jgi:PKD domain